MKRIITTRNRNKQLTLRRTISMPYFSTKNELKEFIEHLDFVYCVEDGNEWKVWTDICTEEKDYISAMGEKGTSNAWNVETIEKYLEEGVFNQYLFMREIYHYENSDVKQDEKILRCYIIEFKE